LAAARASSRPHRPEVDFGPAAAAYDRLRPVDANWREVFEILCEEGDLAGRRVLEVGCGTGRLAAALAERGARVWALDPSPEMLAEAERLEAPGVRFKRGRAESLPFKAGWFERAVMRLVVHHLDRPRAFAELARVLGADGRVALATFDPASFRSYWLNEYFPDIAVIDGARFPAGGELEAELLDAGFVRPRLRAFEQTARQTRAAALERIRGRYISTLRLLSEDAYAAGLERAEASLPAEVEVRTSWFVAVAERER